jgi:hypothetical protein
VSVLPHDAADLWRILAVLLAPPVVAHAAVRYLGAGLAPGSVKVSARQLEALPLPVDAGAWDAGAEHVRAGRVPEAAAVMTDAYGAGAADGLLDWWRERVSRG